ncbi:MAG: efflux RND transporter permease subunit [Endozoicomonas sp. (ex Botrylloides leachii)]|nr:efflux RND transporter permease subunit [Endozoicomonas sp. (ex Botrylloides leachii)]
MMKNKIEENTDRGVIAWFVNNSVAANLLMAIIIVAGLVSVWSIKKKIFPDFDVNTIQVTVNYPGAGSGDIEQSVLVKLEESVKDIAGIKKVISIARDGIGQLIIEVETGYDLDEVYDSVKSSIEGLSNLPEKSERPVISKLEPEKMMAHVAVYGDIDRLSLQRLAQQIHQELLALPEVIKAKVKGEQELEISIEVSEAALRKYGLTFDEVARQLRLSSIDVAGGSIRTSAGDISVKTRGQAYSGIDFADFVVRTNPDGTRLRLGDIARISDGFEEDKPIVRFNKQPAVSVQILSEGEQSDLETSKAIKAYLEKRQQSLPAGVSVTMWADISYYLEGRMNMMLKNMMYGALLVFMLLSLFLRLRIAFWVVVGIPVCFLGALWLMPHGPIPISINLISLFAFILVLGVVVDDAIIIGESVHTQVSRYGHTNKNVIIGVKRVIVPATFGVLTTIAAFLPVLFVEGQGAPFFESIGVVVVLCLVFSIIESKIILPAHLAHQKKITKSKSVFFSKVELIQDRFDEKVKFFISNYYAPLLRKSINNRYITLSIFAGILVIILGLTASPLVRFVFFPKLPSDYIVVELKMNSGTSLVERNEAINQIESSIYKLQKQYALEHTDNALLDSIFVRTISNTEARFIAELTKSEGREINAFQVADQWRDSVGEIPGVKKLNFSASNNAGGSKSIYFRLSGDNFRQLEGAAAELTRKIDSYDGVFDVEDTMETAVDELTLSIRPEAEALGLTLADLGNQVRQGLYGEEVQRIQRGREEVKVMLRYPKEERSELTALEQVRIRTSSGQEVPFYQVATIDFGKGSSLIRRTNGERSIAIMAEVNTKEIEPSAIIDDIEENYLPGLFARYPGVSSGLEGASLEQKALYQQLSIAGVMALLLIYVLIAIPLKSYLQPLIIMSIIPFGLIGAVFGHIIFNISFSLLSMYGLIALAGVLVNDSLILVDFVNKGRRSGLTDHDALVSAGKERFRAIVLTSLTTFLGLVPITMETSLQAQIVIPMAVSLGFGILFATMITLFLIPSLYKFGLDVKYLARRIGKSV